MANPEGFIPQLDDQDVAVSLIDTLSTMICVLGYQIVDANTKRAMMQMDYGPVPNHASQWLIESQKHAWLQLQALRQVISPTTDPSTPPISDK